jgi:hypothetical protein
VWSSQSLCNVIPLCVAHDFFFGRRGKLRPHPRLEGRQLILRPTWSVASVLQTWTPHPRITLACLAGPAGCLPVPGHYSTKSLCRSIFNPTVFYWSHWHRPWSRVWPKFGRRLRYTVSVDFLGKFLFLSIAFFVLRKIKENGKKFKKIISFEV